MLDAEIEAVVGELAGRVGTLVDGVWQPSRDRVVVGLKDGTLILIVPRGPLARLHAVSARPKNPASPFSFQGACRARLRGPLTDVRKAPDERAVTLAFGPRRLELRLTGRSGGLWLVDDEVPDGDPTVVAAFDGPATAMPPLPARGARRDDPPRFARIGMETWNEAAARFFGQAERERDRAELRARVELGLRRALARNQRLQANLHDDLAKADEAPAIRHLADLLASVVHRATKGADAITVDDWDTGAPVTIPLDPSKPPTATLERLYRQAKRLDRVGELVLIRLDAVEAELREQSALLDRIAALDVDALADIAARLPKAQERPASEATEAVPYTTWIGPEGQRVLVGRNDVGNRKLTFQIAKGSDWWMHVRERPGAHLVIPVAKGQSPPLPLLLAAAQIAAHHAKLAPTESAEVQYTRVRDVRPIRGDAGRVTLANEKVLRVVRDPAALAGWSPC